MRHHVKNRRSRFSDFSANAFSVCFPRKLRISGSQVAIDVCKQTGERNIRSPDQSILSSFRLAHFILRKNKDWGFEREMRAMNVGLALIHVRWKNECSLRVLKISISPSLSKIYFYPFILLIKVCYH